jgi:chromosome segregation ATPase
MEITQPEIQSLSEQATALQNRITLLLAEQNRLQALNTSELYTVGQLAIQKKGIEDEIISLKEIFTPLETEVTNLTTQKSTLETSNIEIASSLDARELEISSREKVLNDLENSTKENSFILRNEREGFNLLKVSFDEEQKQFAEKVAQIKAVVNF